MIAVGILALIAVVWRIRIRVFTRAETALLALVAGNWVMIWAQINVSDGVLFPEKRYWIQSFVLLCGWAVWGVDRLSALLCSRYSFAKHLLPLMLYLLILFDFVMIFKPHIPVGRRFAYRKACNWAENVIMRDWKGPEKDEANPFSIKEYHHPNRPVVRAFSKRLAYDLKGRRDNVHIFGKVDTPDYIVIDKTKKPPPGKGYDKIAAAAYASRKFEIYRRKNEKGDE